MITNNDAVTKNAAAAAMTRAWEALPVAALKYAIRLLASLQGRATALWGSPPIGWTEDMAKWETPNSTQREPLLVLARDMTNLAVASTLRLTSVVQRLKAPVVTK